MDVRPELASYIALVFATVVIVLLLVAAIVLLVRGRATISGKTRNVRLLGLVPIVLAGVIFSQTCFTVVQAKEVGVKTTFGKVSQDGLDSGVHLKFPWQHVTEVDATLQTDEYAGDDCISVRIGDGSQSCLTATIRWRVDKDRASEIFSDYRSNDPTENLRLSVVDTQFKAAAQDVLSTYNPIANLPVVTGDDAGAASRLNFAPDYDQVATDLQTQMTTRLGTAPLVLVQSITVSYLSLAASTQDKLNDYIAAVGDTRIALQKQSTAKAEAAANKELSASVSNAPNVLVSKCFDIVTQAAQTGYALPAGFSCWPGGSNAVVVPSGGGSTGGSGSGNGG